MISSKYLYNNEAIGAIAISSVMEKCRSLTHAQAVLILPFLFHEETTSFLKRANSVIRSSEEMIIKKVTYFSNFNARYISLLPISINSMMILREMGVLSFTENKINYVSESSMIRPNAKFGNRAASIVKASNKLANILQNEDVNSLYLTLRIEL